jgi:Flp pilus assembly protein TadD
MFPKVIVLDDPLDKQEHLELGLAYEQDGKLDLAEREYLAADPIPQALLGLGNVYFQKGEHKQAEQCYRRLIREHGDPHALNNLAFLYLIDGRDLEDAVSLAEKAVDEGIRRNLPEDQIRNFKSTYNQAQTALSGKRAEEAGGKK